MSQHPIMNYRQQAAAEIEIGLGHLRAALNLWSPSLGLSPKEEKEDDACKAWQRFRQLVEALDQFNRDTGP
jgi:hypothetical protein